MIEQHRHVDPVFANAGIVDKTEVFADDLDEDGSLKQPEMPIVEVNLTSVIWRTLPYGLIRINRIADDYQPPS